MQMGISNSLFECIFDSDKHLADNLLIINELFHVHYEFERENLHSDERCGMKYPATDLHCQLILMHKQTLLVGNALLCTV